MIKNKQAFTLIELLVVVLIIGILAAVALPQYNKAVQKARFSEALTNIHTLQQAVDAYRLQHGSLGEGYYDISDSLDVSIQSNNFSYKVLWDGYCDPTVYTYGIEVSTNDYIIYSQYCNNTWESQCEYNGTNQKGQTACTLFNQLYGVQ